MALCAPVSNTKKIIPAACCQHGSISTDWKSDMSNVYAELQTVSKTAMSSKTGRKKLVNRLCKSLARLDPTNKKNIEQGRSYFLTRVGSKATSLLLQDDTDSARFLCETYLLMEAMPLGLEDDTESDMSFTKAFSTLEQIQTTQGMVIMLSKRIPCDCLDRLKKQTKKQGRVAACIQCDREVLTKVRLQCSRCRMATYCSRECQVKHWKKHHKKVCALYQECAAL